MRFLFLRSLVVATVAATATASAQKISLASGGTITGTLETSVHGDPIHVYRGIPYAEPPVGDRRWKHATLKPLAGEVNATAYGNVCYGNGAVDAQSWLFPNSEDCLFLNVFAPASATPKSKLSVMVWIHGGGFVSGASNWFDGANLVGASQNQIVYVSINYRLSVFGFLSGDALKGEGAGVNYGLTDQEVAFKWVQQHIARFGGNPNDITIFGESAGAKSVGTHLISRDGNQKLFQKAIAESGTYTTAHDMATKAKQNAMFSQILTQVGCDKGATDAERLACLRAADAKAVWAVGGGLGWQPSVDGVFLKDSPIRRVLDGKVSAVPTILGTNTDEGYGFTMAVKTQDDLVPWLRARFSLLTDAEVSRLVELYPVANFPTATHCAGEIYGDAIYICPSGLNSLVQAKNGHATFRYRFNQTSTTLGPPLVIHTAELNYVFNNVSMLAQDAATQGLVKNVQRYWTNFAITGSPNGASKGDSCGDAGVVQDFQWPQYDATGRQQIVLQASALALETTGAYLPLHDERCAFWHDVEVRLAPTLEA